MSELTKKKKPVAGAIWGVFLGIGLALMAIDRKIIELALVPVLVVVLVGIVLGLVWSQIGPAKQPKSDPPAAQPEPVAAGLSAETVVSHPDTDEGDAGDAGDTD